MCIFFAVLAILGRLCFFIDVPLWLDYFNGNQTYDYNGTIHPLNTNNTSDVSRRIDPMFVLLSRFLFSVIFFGLLTLLNFIFWPKGIGEVERSFPKKQFVVIGVSQGLAAVFFSYSVSGSRTAPYLQTILLNFGIPIQFTIRLVTRYIVCTCIYTVKKRNTSFELLNRSKTCLWN